jgi:hypothetical protein
MQITSNATARGKLLNIFVNDPIATDGTWVFRRDALKAWQIGQGRSQLPSASSHPDLRAVPAELGL